jgi:hypothetical protein
VGEGAPCRSKHFLTIFRTFSEQLPPPPPPPSSGGAVRGRGGAPPVPKGAPGSRFWPARLQNLARWLSLAGLGLGPPGSDRILNRTCLLTADPLKFSPMPTAQATTQLPRPVHAAQATTNNYQDRCTQHRPLRPKLKPSSRRGSCSASSWKTKDSLPPTPRRPSTAPADPTGWNRMRSSSAHARPTGCPCSARWSGG